MPFLSGVLLVSAFALLASGCRGEFEGDMAALDRAFIPALILTEEGGASGAAVMAVKEFKVRWATFNLRYSSLRPDDPDWKGAFDNIDRMVSGADGHSEVGRLKEAHEALVAASAEMTGLRKKFGIDYYIDRFAAFHPAMENLLRAAREGRTNEAEVALPWARTLWQKALGAEFDGALFGFGKEKEKALKERMKEEEAALGALGAALAEGDAEAVLAASDAVEDRYMEAYRLFGDFSGVSRF